MLNDKDTIRKTLTYIVDIACLFLIMLLNLATYNADGNIGRLLSENRLILSLYLTVSALMLLLFKCYEDPLKDYSFFSTAKTGGAILSAHIIFVLLMGVIGQPVPPVFLLNLFVYSVVICGLTRLLAVSFYRIGPSIRKPVHKGDMKRVIIFGAGDAGRYLVDMLNQDKSKKMRPVAFIDDNPRLERKKIKGLLVVGPRELIPYAAKKYKAEIIIIAIPFVNNSTIREIFNLCCEANCTVKRFGNMSSLAFEGLAKSTINEVRVEDLLQREEVKLDLESVKKLIKNKVVLVTGGAGSIGSELCRQILHYGARLLVVFDFNENALFEISGELRQKYHESMFEICLGSIREKDKLESVFEKYRPSIVFHAAAHKHVPLMEINPREALINNIIGTLNVAEAAIANNADRFILISTDKAVNPSNIMGATKRVAELIIQQKNALGRTLFAAVRFGNVLGSNGSVVSVFKRQIREGGPITVTDKEITRYFMTIPEAVQLVLEASSIAQGGEIFVLDMGEPVKIYDLATTMIKLSGLEPDKDIKIEITGLRPGEKLFEELRLSEETVTKTSKDKIFVLKSSYEAEREQIEASFNKLREYIENREYLKAYNYMKILIPSFENEIAV
ncbi:MAG: polysaccharide biosynthesis protein [Bacillota bacterium]